MSKPKSLPKSEEIYDQRLEYLFRRELDSLFILIFSQLDSISDGTDTNASMYSKREHMTFLPIRTILYSGAGPSSGVTYR